MNSIDKLLKNVLYYSGSVTEVELRDLLEKQSDSKMISFTMDIKDSGYEWGKGFVDTESEQRYVNVLDNFIESHSFVERTGACSLKITGEDWHRPDMLNGSAYAFNHPMNWNFTISANKMVELFEACTGENGIGEIRMISVHKVLDVIDISDEVMLSNYATEKTLDMFESNLISMAYNDERFDYRKWECVNAESMIDYWMRKTEFNKVRRNLNKEQDAQQLDVIVSVLTEKSLELYKTHFLKAAYLDVKEVEGVFYYKLKAPSVRNKLSKEAKQEMKEIGILYQNKVKKVKQKTIS